MGGKDDDIRRLVLKTTGGSEEIARDKGYWNRLADAICVVGDAGFGFVDFNYQHYITATMTGPFRLATVLCAARQLEGIPLRLVLSGHRLWYPLRSCL